MKTTNEGPTGVAPIRNQPDIPFTAKWVMSLPILLRVMLAYPITLATYQSVLS